MITTANSISQALKNKETITVLNLKSSRLDKVPEEIKILKKLTHLYIRVSAPKLSYQYIF